MIKKIVDISISKRFLCIEVVLRKDSEHYAVIEIGQEHERKGRKAKTLGQYERRLRQRYL